MSFSFLRKKSYQLVKIDKENRKKTIADKVLVHGYVVIVLPTMIEAEKAYNECLFIDDNFKEYTLELITNKNILPAFVDCENKIFYVDIETWLTHSVLFVGGVDERFCLRIDFPVVFTDIDRQLNNICCSFGMSTPSKLTITEDKKALIENIIKLSVSYVVENHKKLLDNIVDDKAKIDKKIEITDQLDMFLNKGVSAISSVLSIDNVDLDFKTYLYKTILLIIEIQFCYEFNVDYAFNKQGNLVWLGQEAKESKSSELEDVLIYLKTGNLRFREQNIIYSMMFISYLLNNKNAIAFYELLDNKVVKHLKRYTKITIKQNKNNCDNFLLKYNKEKFITKLNYTIDHKVHSLQLSEYLKADKDLFLKKHIVVNKIDQRYASLIENNISVISYDDFFLLSKTDDSFLLFEYPQNQYDYDRLMLSEIKWDNIQIAFCVVNDLDKLKDFEIAKIKLYILKRDKDHLFSINKKIIKVWSDFYEQQINANIQGFSERFAEDFLLTKIRFLFSIMCDKKNFKDNDKEDVISKLVDVPKNEIRKQVKEKNLNINVLLYSSWKDWLTQYQKNKLISADFELVGLSLANSLWKNKKEDLKQLYEMSLYLEDASFEK